MTAKEYNETVTQWADGLYRFALKLLDDIEEAKDVVQQSFETLWVKKEEVISEKAKSYLFTIAHRRCMDVHRKQKTVAMPDTALHIGTAPDDRKEWKDYLEEALSKLDAKSKTLILLKDYEGYNYETIGKITGLTLEQVKVYLHRARKNLKNYLIAKKQIL